MSGWEEIDSDATDHFAVVFGEDYSIQPDAIFRSREDADAYVAWQLSLPPSDDRYIPREVTVLALRDLKAVAWNSYDPLPEDGPPEKPKPAPSSRPTVRVRISVDVDDDGQHGVGYDDDAAAEEYERAFGPTGRKRHVVRVTADVPLPEASPEVKGEVVT